MILIVDAMPICYQAWAAVAHLKTSTGIPSGLQYGFLRQIASYAKKFKPRQVGICWDTADPIVKAKALGDTYKSNRVMTEDKAKMFGQIPELRRLLSYTRWSQFQAPGYEADDLCYTIGTEYAAAGEEAVIATVDRDIFAAVSDLVSVYHLQKDKKLITPREVENHFRVAPCFVPLMKAIFGDASDTVKGIWSPMDIQKVHSVGNLLATVDPHEPDQMAAGLVALARQFPSQDWEVVHRNLVATMLEIVPKEAAQFQPGANDAGKLMDEFVRLEMRSMLDRLPEFVDVQTAENPQ